MPRKNIDVRGVKLCPSCMQERFVFVRLMPGRGLISIKCNKYEGCGAKTFVPDDDPALVDYYMG